MLHSISWEIYLTTLAISVASYYTITILLLYYPEISRLTRVWNRIPDSDPGDVRPHTTLMGDTLRDLPRETRISVNTSEEIKVAPTEPEREEPVASPKDNNTDASILIGTVADLLQDLQDVSKAIRQSNTPNQQAVTLIKTLLHRYPQVRETFYREAITFYINNLFRKLFPADAQTDLPSWWEG